MKKTLLGLLCPFSRHFSRILSFRIMLMFLVISLHAFQLQAADTVGKITLHANGKPLKEVLRDIEAQTGYRFFYSTKLVDENKKVSVDANNASINTVVAEILKADPTVTFKIKGDQIMIQRQRSATSYTGERAETHTATTITSESTPTEADVLTASYENDVDPITITGTVLDETNTPLPGVSVIIKGTTIGTATDADGKYTLSVPDLSATSGILVYSFIGYMSEEVPVNSRTAIDVNLVPDISTLSEVVVVGFGTVKKRDMTGSVASVKTTELILTPTHNAVESMQGRVAGVDITRTSGSPGSSSAITIRGNRTIPNPANPQSQTTTPLYVVDGIQIPLGGDLTNINPNDIESIEILKDASATAIYGAMGANGVVLVTTKKGAEGRTKINYNGYVGINIYDYPKGRTGDSYIQLRRDAFAADGQWASPADDDKMFAGVGELDAVKAGQWVDWVDLVKHDGLQQSHAISLSSGTQKTKIFASGSYFREDGMFKDQDYTRYNTRFNIDHNASERVKIGLLTQLNYSITNERKDPLSQALSVAPLGLPYDDKGGVNIYALAGNTARLSPLADERNDAIAKNNTLNGGILANGYIEINPFKGLTFRSNLGVTLNQKRKGVYNDKTSLSSESSKLSSAAVTNTFSRSYNFDNVLTYKTEFEGGHGLTVTALTSYIRSDEDEESVTAIGQVSGAQLFYALDGASSYSNVYNKYTGWKNMAYAGRLNYSYNGKYLVTFSSRYDGASRLAPGNKWAYFPSVALGWNITDEAFMAGITKTVSNLKLRASYGTAGNYAIAPYGTQTGLTATRRMSFGEVSAPSYIFKTTLGNQNLGWEKTATTNIGLDVEILNGIINGTIDVYNAKTTDILMSQKLPTSSGLTDEYKNIGESQNRGIEIAITSRNITTDKFKWSSTVTFTKNQEKIIALTTGKDQIVDETQSRLIGRPIKSFYTYKKLGIWQTAEAEEAKSYHIDKIDGTPFKPGDIKLADLDNDHVINSVTDRTYVGAEVPKWVVGLQNNFTYKNFDLGVFLFARWGQTINAQYLGKYNPSGNGNSPDYFNYWTPTNPSNDFPSPMRDQNISGIFGYQSLNFIDGSYFKVKNVTFGYTLPTSVVEKASITRVRFYVTGSNLYTKAKSHLIKHYDPERGGADSYPLSRTFVFGVNVDF